MTTSLTGLEKSEGEVTLRGWKNSSSSSCVTVTPRDDLRDSAYFVWLANWIGTRREIVGVMMFAAGVWYVNARSSE